MGVQKPVTWADTRQNPVQDQNSTWLPHLHLHCVKLKSNLNKPSKVVAVSLSKRKPLEQAYINETFGIHHNSLADSTLVPDRKAWVPPPRHCERSTSCKKCAVAPVPWSACHDHRLPRSLLYHPHTKTRPKHGLTEAHLDPILGWWWYRRGHLKTDDMRAAEGTWTSACNALEGLVWEPENAVEQR